MYRKWKFSNSRKSFRLLCISRMKLWGERIKRRLCVIDQSKSYKKLKWRSSRSSIKFTCRFKGKRYYRGGCGWTTCNTSWKADFNRSLSRTRSIVGICSHGVTRLCYNCRCLLNCFVYYNNCNNSNFIGGRR